MKKILCPHCGGTLPPDLINWASAHLSGFARLKGDAKRRSSESARKAARARWDKVKAAKKLTNCPEEQG
jgi:hypothetical protein